MGPSIAPQQIRISHAGDIPAARKAAEGMAVSVGHAFRVVHEIGLACVELATNILKYAETGTISIKSVADGRRRGIQIESMDNGPGIRNFEEAIVDGFSTSGSLGYGLGSVLRMMDELEKAGNIHGSRGTHVICKRWVKNDPAASGRCPLDIGAATRSYPGMKQNGDAFIINKWGKYALVGVVDGLGHGQYAHHASQKARQYVDSHYDLPLKDIFRGVHRSCRATRGVVMALARFDWETNMFSYASVGNIEARVINARQPARFQIRRGIIGKNAPNPVETTHPWDAAGMLVLYSDGISTHWQWRDFIHLSGKTATDISYHLMRALGKENDDATVLVVKNKSGRGNG